MILITSAAYVGQELASEFGRLPPSFLPVGNKRLFNYQIAQFLSGKRIVLTIPEGFQISSYDQEKLDDLGVDVLPIPEGLSLGESVVCDCFQPRPHEKVDQPAPFGKCLVLEFIRRTLRRLLKGIRVCSLGVRLETRRANDHDC